MLATQLALLLGGAMIIGGFLAYVTRLNAASAGAAVPEAIVEQLAAQQRRVEEVRGELDVTRLQLERASEIIRFSSRYRIPADLSAAIYDIALAEGIHPSVGFQVVKVESRFAPNARSSRGAIGYTQIRVSTARAYDPKITEAELHRRDVNLRLGFRYFRDLMERYRDLDLALLAYNRGPTKVDSIRSAGGDPANGYAETIRKGLSRSGEKQIKQGS